MSKTIYLNLFFFCGIWCQGMFATLSDKDTSLSSDSLVRKRRVIDHSPGGQHETVNYIVKIVLGNEYVCQGAILSHYTVITASRCIFGPATTYNVLSGGEYDDQWNFHNVTSQTVYFGNPPSQAIDGIMLMNVHPPFVYSRKTGNIELYAGPLPAGSLINVFGWERVYPTSHRAGVQYKLRTLTLPIMNQEECMNLYHDNIHVTIFGKHICTVYAEQFCYRDEIGSPLVIDNRLAGIHTWKGKRPGQLNPDIFVNFQHEEYSEWIIRHVSRM